MNLWFVLNGLIIAIVIILIWVIYAYKYKTSIERLCKLAAKKYIPTVPADIQEKYLIQCDPKLSKYDSTNKQISAVMTIVPDMNHQNAPNIPNVVKIYKIIDTSNDCENNITACGEKDQTRCMQEDAKQIVIKAAECINIS